MKEVLLYNLFVLLMKMDYRCVCVFYERTTTESRKMVARVT